MRRVVIGVALAFAVAAVAPRTARGDVAYPPIPSNIDPSTVTWFYGCTDALPGACVIALVGQVLPPAFGNYLFWYASGGVFRTPFDVQFSVSDQWGLTFPGHDCNASGSAGGPLLATD